MKEQRQSQVSLYKCLKHKVYEVSVLLCFHYNYRFPCAFHRTKFCASIYW